MLCREQAAQLCRDHDRVLQAGATLAVVGQGTPIESAAFERDLGLFFTVLADPDRAAFAAYGLMEGGPHAFLHPTAVGRVVWALLRGTGVGRPVGSTRQLPGTFVIDRGGIVRFAKPALHAADTPTTEDLLNAIACATITAREGVMGIRPELIAKR